MSAKKSGKTRRKRAPRSRPAVPRQLNSERLAVETVPLADADATPLGAEVAALVAALANAGDAVRGQLSIRTFGPDEA